MGFHWFNVLGSVDMWFSFLRHSTFNHLSQGGIKSHCYGLSSSSCCTLSEQDTVYIKGLLRLVDMQMNENDSYRTTLYPDTT